MSEIWEQTPEVVAEFYRGCMRSRDDRIKALEAEVARLRHHMRCALMCTPSVRGGEIIYDCGDPWEVLRSGLGPPAPSPEPGPRRRSATQRHRSAFED
jgi:hypothetical protein